MIRLRAPSSAALSPPEVIHLIPPQIRKRSAVITASIKRIVKTREIPLAPPSPGLSLQSDPNDPSVSQIGIGLGFSANATAGTSKRDKVKKNTRNRFTLS